MAEPKWASQRPTFEEYGDWLAYKANVDIEMLRNHYLATTSQVKNAVEQSEFWKCISDNLQEINDRYLIDKKDRLIDLKMPEIYVKPWRSFLDKTFRKNVLRNDNYPSPPDGGWILPPDWLSSLNDVVRTTFAVRYLDGVEYLSARFITHCQNSGLTCSRDYEAKLDGYYAIHLYVFYEVEVPDLGWKTERRQVRFEIQVTTEIKELIKKILHKFYDVNRLAQENSGTQVAWNYNSDEFIANSLGHMIHYVEGMVVQVRDRQGNKK